MSILDKEEKRKSEGSLGQSVDTDGGDRAEDTVEGPEDKAKRA